MKLYKKNQLILIYFFITFFINNLYTNNFDFFLTASIDGGLPEKKYVYFITKGQQLKFHIIIKKEKILYSDTKYFKVNGKIYKTNPLTSNFNNYDWIIIKPILKEYSNLWIDDNCNKLYSHIAPILYKKEYLHIKNNLPVLNFNKIIGKENYGTYYFTINLKDKFKLVKKNKNLFFSSQSFLPKQFSNKIVQVVYRKDNTYLGYLTELFNTPFIMCPKHLDNHFHETEYRIGSDCAAFAIYGMRRMGYNIPYCGPRYIYNYLDPIGKGIYHLKMFKNTLIYINENCEKISVNKKGLQPGDILHFREQVSVFYKDLGIKGILDKDDLLIQSYNETPYITSIEESGFDKHPARFYKWKKMEKGNNNKKLFRNYLK
jgi:hypothetical protein